VRALHQRAPPATAQLLRQALSAGTQRQVTIDMPSFLQRGGAKPAESDDANDAAAAAAAEPQAGEEEAPEEGGEMLEFSNPPPLGNCQLLVHAVDARDLAPRDSDNTSDPVVKVLCA
jgi:hypothetical protein